MPIADLVRQINGPGRTVASAVGMLARLEKGQARNIQRIRNIITDHASPSDFSGVALERAGGSVPKPGGGPFDHVGEMVQSLRDLWSNVERLRNSLDDPAHSRDLRDYVEAQIRIAEHVADRMQDALNRSGGVMNEPAIWKTLCSDDVDQIIATLSRLGAERDQAPSATLLDRVVELIAHADPDVRHQAIFAAGLHWSYRPALSSLIRVLRKPSAEC